MTWKTSDAAALAGCSKSLATLLVREGVIRPAVTARGTGDQNRFDLGNVKQLKAYSIIRQRHGDGSVARGLVARLLPLITADTQYIPGNVEENIALEV